MGSHRCKTESEVLYHLTGSDHGAADSFPQLPPLVRIQNILSAICVACQYLEKFTINRRTFSVLLNLYHVKKSIGHTMYLFSLGPAFA